MKFEERNLRTAVVAALAVVANVAYGQGFVQTNLVANGGGAKISDPSLVNPWGMSYSPTGAFWVSNNGSGTSTLYDVAPADDATTKLGLTVTIPGVGTTGQVYTGGTGFNGNLFLFVNEDGTISGWRSALGTVAEILATGQSSNVYKGSAASNIGGHEYLYAANFRSGAVDVYKGDGGAPNLTGSFIDPNLPSGYAPFNVQNLGGDLYVTYALQAANQFDEVDGPGLGFVDKFDIQGNLLGRVATGGTLNAPWGLAIAPGSFGAFAGDLLVGNFGDGTINAYDLTTQAFEGQLQDAGGDPLSIDGLWALMPGNGGSGGSTDRLYFTAGPNGEADGLFGSLAPVPEPGSFLVLAGLGAMIRRRRLRA